MAVVIGALVNPTEIDVQRREPLEPSSSGKSGSKSRSSRPALLWQLALQFHRSNP
jgi:hypothetical protein